MSWYFKYTLMNSCCYHIQNIFYLILPDATKQWGDVTIKSLLTTTKNNLLTDFIITFNQSSKYWESYGMWKFACCFWVNSESLMSKRHFRTQASQLQYTSVCSTTLHTITINIIIIQYFIQHDNHDWGQKLQSHSVQAVCYTYHI